MTRYLSYKFEDTPEFIHTFDEMPLWSASFGLLLLKHLEYKHNLAILDIGSGAGFPLTELAARFGNTCKCYGQDTWTNANNRARQKISNYGLQNVEILEGSAEKILLDDNSIDLAVSNLGINNFDNPPAVFAECKRVLKPGGKLAITTNLNGHWQEFYDIFDVTLSQLGKHDIITRLKEQQEHRGTIASISQLFETNGLKITRQFSDSFEMKFTDGTAFLNHHFVKLGWLSSWISLFDIAELEAVFSLLEKNLNDAAEKNNGLTLTVPMAFMEGQKNER